jgi:adenine-specific DNA-methyltransferase
VSRGPVRSQLIHGDNARVLSERAQVLAGAVRLAYLDPPYNTGRTFAEYTDRTEPSTWSARLSSVAKLVHPLLRADGVLVAEIDDTELGALIVLLDDVFGRANRVAVVTVVRSAATGHKARNKGPVNVTDYLLVYAKDRRAFAPRALHRARDRYDDAYRTWIENPSDPPPAWRFVPLRRAFARARGFASLAAARRALGPEAFERELTTFALAHAEHVVRFAQPRYEAISHAAQALVDRSRAAPDDVFVLERAKHPPFIVRGGNRILRLRDKVRTIDGVPRLVEPLTNVWDDIGFQGIAREGGVTFSRNKKPERLMARIVEMFTDEGDLVLDPYAGSGTTLAVAERMKRRWIGIEREAPLIALCKKRLAS